MNLNGKKLEIFEMQKKFEFLKMRTNISNLKRRGKKFQVWKKYEIWSILKMARFRLFSYKKNRGKKFKFKISAKFLQIKKTAPFYFLFPKRREKFRIWKNLIDFAKPSKEIWIEPKISKNYCGTKIIIPYNNFRITPD